MRSLVRISYYTYFNKNYSSRHRICWISNGYLFCRDGNNGTCVDIDIAKVQKISAGQITIYEPGIVKIVLRNIKEERLSFTTQLEEGVEDAEISL